MKKIICLFPGQGSQYVGMGKNFDDTESKNILNAASESLGFDLQSMMLNGPEEELKKTEFTQPAILTHSYLIFKKLERALMEKELSISVVMGHSVGEYAALVAAGSIDFESAVKAVHMRGKFMQEAVGLGDGAMLAILKVDIDDVKKACNLISIDDSIVMPANINSPGQIVVSGHASACERLQKWFAENYNSSYRIVPLKVSAPFHSSLMKPAETKLQQFFEQVEIRENQIPYIDNLTAKVNRTGTPGKTIESKLIGQVSGAVLWSDSVTKFSPEENVFLEVGPGKTLMGICRSIDRAYKVTSLDIDNLQGHLKEIL
jgi:[acyl-carrier-protein] S-malonyltransferase